MTTGSRIGGGALRPTTPDFGAVARSLLGVLGMSALALTAGYPGAAVWTAAAGAIAGGIAMQDSPGGRVPLVIVVSAQMGVAVLLGALTSALTVLFIAVVALWCFAAGMQWALGRNAGLVATAAGALLVIAPPNPSSFEAVLVPTVLTIAAGCVQAALIAVWPPHRWRMQRDALSRAYRSLAADARRVATNRDASVNVAPLTWLRDVFVDSQATRRPKAYHGGYRLPERTMAALRELQRAQDGDGDGVSQLLDDAAAALDAIAFHSHTARREAEHALVRMDTVMRGLTGTEAAAAQRFSQQLHQAAEFRFPDLRRPDLISPLRAAAVVVAGHLSWRSPILRHAVRLSAATALAIAADRFAPINHGYWIALTVLMVLRPESAHTYTRCFGRVGGIAAGVVVASLITLLWLPTGSAAAVTGVLFLGLMYAVNRFGHIASAAALSAAAVFLLNIDALAASATMEDRLFSIAIGGGFAVVAHVAFPDHALTRLRHRAGELLKAEVEYAATVIKAFMHEIDHPTEAVEAAWQRAYRARAAFEAASGATRLDSRELRRWLRSLRAALNAVTGACTSLENSMQAQIALTPEFVAAVDDYVDALRGAPPNPATAWSVDAAALTSATQQVREKAATLTEENRAARVLVAEIATITRSLIGIDASREPTSAQ
ncbi:FUSC family protein [Mycolicibacterium sp. XJ1819]